MPVRIPNPRLGANDQAIVEFQRTMLNAVIKFSKGEPAIGPAQKLATPT